MVQKSLIMEELFKRRQKIKNLNDDESRKELDEVENKLAEMCALSNYEKIKEEIQNIDCDEGGINSEHLWKLKKKLSPKCRDPPTAMLDKAWNLLTSNEAIEELVIQTYTQKLENR